MENVFHTEKRKTPLGERSLIIIRRLPSQMPYGIDSHLFRLAGISNLKGPDNKVEYQFHRLPDFDAGVKFLKDCGWAQSKEPIG